MEELSLHILDLAENSAAAGAVLIQIDICASSEKDLLQISIADDGSGMDQETVLKVQDPFYTTRTTRKVGLGIPLFKAITEACGGELTIQSAVGKGTRLATVMQLSHIDRPPLGVLSDTMATLMMCHPDLNFDLRCEVDGRVFCFSSEEIKKDLTDVPINTPDVIVWLKEYLEENLEQIYGGVQI